MNRKELYNKLQDAFKEGLNLVIEHEEDFFRYNLIDNDDYPVINYKEDSGYPYFYYSRNSKRNYTRLLLKYSKKLESWKEVHNYLLSNEDYCKFFFINKFSNFEDKIDINFYNNFYTVNQIGLLVNRYIHIYKTTQFEENYFEALFTEWSNYFLLEKLNFDIVIPILMLTFDFDFMQLTDLITIERMNETFQKSRNIKTSKNSSSHQNVISSATHAFVLKNYSINNETDNDSKLLSEISYYRNVIADPIDKLFAYLRTTINVDTGYSQIIARPTNWGYVYTADLMPIFVVTTKAYPDYFEKSFWNNIPNKFSSEIFVKDQINRYLIEIPRNLQVAITRLNNAFLRRNMDDSILEITIALEALFIESKDNSEVTYKFSTRAAILCKLFPIESFSPFQVFKACKNIYKFRSAIVHSKELKEVDGSKMLKSNIHPNISTIEAGIKILSHSVNILLANPQFLNVEELDKSIFH